MFQGVPFRGEMFQSGVFLHSQSVEQFGTSANSMERCSPYQSRIVPLFHVFLVRKCISHAVFKNFFFVTARVNIELREASILDFNYTNNKMSKKARIGMYYWVDQDGALVRYVLKPTTDREELKSLVNSGKVLVIKETHPRDNIK